MEPKPTATLLTQFLRDNDAECPVCGYNLRGLTGSACPECSKALTLAVAAEQPFFKVWFTSILPLWLVGGGFALFLLVMVCVRTEYIISSLRNQRNMTQVFWVLGYTTLAALLLLPAAIFLTRAKGRRWLVVHPKRKLIAGCCVAASALVLLVWVVWLYQDVN